MEIDEEQANMNGTGKASADSAIADEHLDRLYGQLMDEAMDYGQVLRREYRDVKVGEYTTTLQNIFSLIIYDEPRVGVHGHLLDINGRAKVAEEVNSAILGKLRRYRLLY